MIVVDANILIYLIVEGDMTGAALRLQEKDSDWRTSPLWEYEFGNALALMIHQKHLTPRMAAHLFPKAKDAFIPGEMKPDSELSLQLAAEKRLSFYHAQYLTLAQILNVPLITEDKALRKAAGKSALSVYNFLN